MRRLRVFGTQKLNADWVRDLKAQSAKDIWLFGGSNLFRSFFDSGLVDGVEVAVIPVLLTVFHYFPSLQAHQTAIDLPSPLPIGENVVGI
jgi:dihydrofolate reductase